MSNKKVARLINLSNVRLLCLFTLQTAMHNVHVHDIRGLPIGVENRA